MYKKTIDSQQFYTKSGKYSIRPSARGVMVFDGDEPIEISDLHEQYKDLKSRIKEIKSKMV